MAFDGAFLSCLRAELQDTLRDARIDKIHQPSREELVLSLRRRNGAEKLYISARANSPRIHFTAVPLENPAQPPMFCMLLRKRMTGGRLAAIRQPGLERALYLDFDCVNELGDIVRLTLAVEIMGRHSNIILVENGQVVDAIMANITFIPMIITAVTLVFLYFYPITEAYGRKMREELTVRRQQKKA